MNKIKKYDYIIISAVIGAVAFLLIYGFGTLDVTNDGWILTGYDEWDIVQHYTGWMNYRNSVWDFPLGNVENLAYSDIANIAFSDSIPLVSVFFKLLSPLLPEKFQFFGLFVFTSFILQGAGSALLLNEIADNKITAVLGSVFFVFSPVFLERAFRHTSLTAHCIFIYAMYLYFKYRKDTNTDGELPWRRAMLLSALSVGITPYLLPMVMIFVLLTAIDVARKNLASERIVRGAVFFVSCCASAVAMGFVLGTLGQGISSSRGGYGFFSMNLNAIINPKSCGNYTWSSFLPVRGQLFGQYDGFNYFGFGILLFVIFITLACAVNVVKNKQYDLLITAVKDNISLIFACIFLTCFAVSNVVCFSKHILLEIPFPEFFLELCGIFRASSRMFWPVYYLVFVFVITACTKLFSKKQMAAAGIIILFLGIQIYDIKGALVEKHNAMEEKLNYSFSGDAELLSLNEYTTMVECHKEGDRYWLYLSGWNHLVTNGSDFNSGVYENAKEFGETEMERIETEMLNTDYIYVTDDTDLVDRWQHRFGNVADFCKWQTEEPADDWPGRIVYFMIPHR